MTTALLVALVGGVAVAKPKDEPAEVPAAPVDPGDSARAAEFTLWATALGSGNRQAAMDALIAIVEDPTKEFVAGEAYAAEGYPLAAIGAIGRGMELDPVHTGPMAGR